MTVLDRQDDGGLSGEGLITLEDVIETLFSIEIVDEFDQAMDMRQVALEKWAARREDLDLWTAAAS